MITAWWQCIVPVHGFPAGWLWGLWALLPLQVAMTAGFLYRTRTRR
jgi:hypothetical protein